MPPHPAEAPISKAKCNGLDRDLVYRDIAIRDIDPEPIEWVWPGRIPLGKLSLYAGMPGIGKTAEILDTFASMTRSNFAP